MPRLFSLCAALCLMALSALSASAASTATAQKQVRVIIQLSGYPLATNAALKVRTRETGYRLRLDPALPVARWYTDRLNAYQDREIAYLRHQGIALDVTYRFHVLINGLSATVPASQLPQLRELTNVRTVTPQHVYHPLLDHNIQLVNAPAAWQLLGGSSAAGKGMLIADIDTGIDTHNPCFRDAGFAPPAQYGGQRRADTKANLALTNNKVVVVRAFGPDDQKTYSAVDKVGHGTDTAAIEACDYNTPTPAGTDISGVAPAAQLLVYNVFPGGAAGASDSGIIRALESALLDGADVVNMSLGSGSTGGDSKLDPEIYAVNNDVKAGVVVVVSAGNDGPTPQTVTSPATAANAIAVGAVTNSQAITSTVSVNSPGIIPADLSHIAARQSDHPFDTAVGPAQLVYAGYGRKPGDDSKKPNIDEFAGQDFHGKIALIERGSDTGTPIFFETKVKNATAAGAVGVIIYDNRDEVSLSTPATKSATLPTMFISQTDGQALLAWLHQHPDTQITMDPHVSSVSVSPDVLTDFSARGPGAGYTVKPDLVAPGSDIYSATESKYSSGEMYDPSGFTSEEGTSFSAPHVTGAVALLLQKHPKWTPATVKDVLMGTAQTEVYLDKAHQDIATVPQSGAGLLNVGAAEAAVAYASPGSISFSELNAGSDAVTQSQQITLNDIGGGSGTWQVSLDQKDTEQGLALSVPSSITLPANGTAPLTMQASVPGGLTPGVFDGFITLTHGTQTLHVPYIVHVANQTVQQGSILLVDVTKSLYQPGAPNPPIQRADVAPYFERTLDALHRSYTYWDESVQGVPSLSDLKRASAVIYFTGSNLNQWSPPNSDPEALIPPIDTLDIEVLHSYIAGGGHVLMTGMGAALTDPDFTVILMGGETESFSVYDNLNNDPNRKAGMAPPQPSAVPDTGVGPLAHAGIFAGLKAVDFSSKGDGANDNIAQYLQVPTDTSDTLGTFVGVSGLSPVRGNFGFQGRAYGQPALKTVNPGNSEGGTDVAVVNSDEPSLSHKPTFAGRAVLMSFGFEGINDNTGYATREQVMQRILQWFGDQPVAGVVHTQYQARHKVTLRATLRSGAKPAAYIWQIGSSTLHITGKPTTYTFPRPGKYQVRVQITDALGHVAVSPWTTVIVG